MKSADGVLSVRHLLLIHLAETLFYNLKAMRSIPSLPRVPASARWLSVLLVN